MTGVLFCIFLIFLIYSGLRAVRASRNTSTAFDFFSFGSEHDPSIVRRAFQATNVSFTTSFISLYLLTFAQGVFTLLLPAAFCLGIVVYASYFLPRQMSKLASGKRYPELLAQACGSGRVRPLASVFVAISLYLFMFAEVQGLSMFLKEVFSSFTILAPAVPMILVSAIGFYVSRNGYRATTANDRFQVRLIFIGAIAVILLSLAHLFSAGSSSIIAVVRAMGNPFGSSMGLGLGIAEALIGFVFSQLLYYDNWQRLGFYVSAEIGETSSVSEGDLRRIAARIRHEYLVGSIPLAMVFSAPILLGLVHLSSGIKEPSYATLNSYLASSWSNYSFAGPLLVSLAFIFFLSALVSTCESYLVAIVNCVLEDMLGFDIGNRESDPTASRLLAIRMATVAVSLSLVPLLFWQPDFAAFFGFLFYSANGFVGPLLFLTLNKRMHSLAVLSSIAFGFLYAGTAVFGGAYATLAPYPGIVPVFVSLGLVGISAWKESNHAGS